MKQRSLVFLSLLLSLAFVPATQAADFSLLGSYYNTDDYDEAVGVGARVGFGGNVQFEAGATYYEEFGNSFSFDLGDLGFQDLSLDLEVIPVDAGVRFNLGGGPVYFALGGTYFLLASDNGSVDDEFGIYGRIGAQFRHLFVEGGYRGVEGTVDEIDFDEFDTSSDLDFDLTGFFANLGWRF